MFSLYKSLAGKGDQLIQTQYQNVIGYCLRVPKGSLLFSSDNVSIWFGYYLDFEQNENVKIIHSEKTTVPESKTSKSAVPEKKTSTITSTKLLLMEN